MVAPPPPLRVAFLAAPTHMDGVVFVCKPGVRDFYSKRASRQRAFHKRPLSAANTYAVVTVSSLVRYYLPSDTCALWLVWSRVYVLHVLLDVWLCCVVLVLCCMSFLAGVREFVGVILQW